MKKFLTTMLMFLAFTVLFGQTYTVNLSGGVFDEENGEPIVQSPVWIMTDSISDYFYSNMLTTDVDGIFEDSFDVPSGVAGTLFVSAIDCEGMMVTSDLSFSENSSDLSVVFSVCGTPSEDDCEADFYAYPENNDGLTLQFMDVSAGFPTDWEWDFGDGESSTEQNPLHTFPDIGEYSEYLVSLSISDDSSGCTSIVERVVGVGDSIIWFPDSCMAMFYSYPEGNDWLTMQFMDISMGDPTTWDWDFGDGSTSDDQNPLHTFPESGEYFVNLTIFNDSLDCTSSIELPVMVGDSIWIPDSCMAWFFAFPDSSDFMTFNFWDMSIGNEGNIPDSWFWDFGDGITSDEQNPTHTFTTEGIYEVCLTISDENQTCSSTYCESIEVVDWDAYCQAQFYYYPTFDSLGNGDELGIQFMDYSFGNPTNWTWDFGDGGTSDEQNPIYFYSEEGIYNVCLTIANPIDSCQSTMCQEVFIMSDTTFDCFGWFEYEMDEMTVDFTGYLDNSQSGEYTWDFGDGTTGEGQLVSHTYSEDGIYAVTMMVEDSSTNCFAAYTDIVWVGEDFSIDVEGFVYLDDSMMVADYANVYLMTFDTIYENLISVAETQIDENGYYIFEDVSSENCIYFVQADLTDASAYYGDYLPTYHFSSMTWEEAWPVFPFPMEYTYDVFMIPTQSMNSGSGIINGNVGYEGERTMLEDVNVMLLDVEGNPYTFRSTNENGEFDFSELSYGTYVVYTEIMGVHTVPVTIELSADNPEATINIVVRNGEAVLGIGDRQSAFIESIGDVFPNPVTQNASLNITMKKGSTVRIEIRNNYGQLLTESENSISQGIQKMDLNTENFPKGIYFISVKADDGISMVKKLVKL